MSSTNAPNRLIYHQVQEYTSFLFKKKKVSRRTSIRYALTSLSRFSQDHRVYNRCGYGREWEDCTSCGSMGWKRDARLVRCLLPAGFECESHPMVNSGPKAIDIININYFPCKFARVSSCSSSFNNHQSLYLELSKFQGTPLIKFQ